MSFVSTKKYLFLSLLISIGSLFSQRPSLLQATDQAVDNVYGEIYHDNDSSTMDLEEAKETPETGSFNIPSAKNDQDSTPDDASIYSQHSIMPCEKIDQPNSPEKSSSHNFFSPLTNARNNSTITTSHSLLKNPSDWLSSRTRQQKEALIKTGVFITACGIATFFPEFSIAEKLFFIVCLPCFIELGETLITTASAFS